tara:strand:- start:1442 stop:3499 length:2058 start_codon:yes stop_codon:yes gene_type:complete
MITYGGGGGSDPAPLPVATPAVMYSSDYPELAGQSWNSPEKRDAAQANVVAERAALKARQDAAAAKANTDASNYSATAMADLNAAAQKARDKINTLSIELSQLQAGDQANPSVVAAIATKQKAIETAQKEAMTIGQAQTGELKTGQQKLVSKAIIDPTSLAKSADVATMDANTYGTNLNEGTGQVSAATPTAVAGQVGTTATAGTPEAITAATIATKTATDETKTALEDVTAAKGTLSAGTQVTGATVDATQTGVKDLTAAEGTATLMDSPIQREIKAGELIEPVANAAKAVAYAEEIQAATADPSEQAMVKGQLDGLMQDFEGGATPAWAAGAMRAATAAMAARGLGASSLAGQAIVQATMEAALPIAMADAQTTASFEAQNLSNRQQRAMLAAEQRAAFMGQEFDQAFQARVQNASKISDVANMNFTAQQQVALENSRAANTMSLANMSNKQALVMANASIISQLESQNLSNLQQAAVQNASSFLQMDMANLSNSQQTELFKAQSIQQSILTDAAAENAAKQFNASSENQTKQFMSNLAAQTSQFNAAQTNAIAQFNANEEGAASQFNASLMEQRNQFNAQNALVIAQANAQWRQNVATLNTAAQNDANTAEALAANGFTQGVLDQIWQRERDLMDYAYKGSESAKQRALDMVLADRAYDEYAKVRAEQEKTDMWGTVLDILF